MTRRTPFLLMFVLILSTILFATPAIAQSDEVPSFVMATWNIQSGQSDPEAIANQMALFDGVHLWFLQEVNRRETAYYKAGAEDGEFTTFGIVLSSAGDGNHLLTLYDESLFELVQSRELSQINTTGNARPALVLHLRDIETDVEFLVINNHLYSSRPEERLRQASLLATWASQQTLPVIAGGDMNFVARNSDPAFAAMSRGDLWQRIEPDNDGPTRPNGRAIDHIFVAGDAVDWPISAMVVEREFDLDNDLNSDHRPVLGLVGPEVALPLVPCSTLAQECLLEPVVQSTNTTQTATASLTDNTEDMVTVTSASVNLRGGAGTNFPIVGNARLGDAFVVTGYNSDGSWLQLANGAWIAAFLVESTVAETELEVASRSSEITLLVTPAPTARPTSTPVSIPPTPTSVPTSPPERAQSAGGLVIIELDKRAEYAVIRNDSDSAIDLGGWVLLSERGNQACPLGGVIEPDARLTISAMGDIPGFNCGFKSNIWNNSERDPAVLIAPNGTVVSRSE